MDKHVTAGDVDLVFERHRDGHRRKGLVVFAREAEDRPDPARLKGRHHQDLVAHLHDPRGDLACETSEIQVRPHHVLDRQPQIDQVPVAPDIDVLQVLQDRLAVIPRHVLTAFDDVIPHQGADRDELEVGDSEARRKVPVLGDDLVEDLLRVTHEVHLVDRDQESRNAQEGCDEGMPLCLGQDPVARIDQDDGQVRG